MTLPAVGAVLVIIPTYNERATLPATLHAVRTHVPAAHVLVVDDASPDGTGQWAQARARHDEAVSVLHRRGKEGLGRAYLAGFEWGLRQGYDFLVEMDADGSHRGADLPELLRAAGDGDDLVIGSRWVPGGAVLNWPRRRQWLSRGANRYARVALGLPVADATAGFRVYPASTLRGLDLAAITSQGYCFQIDLTWRVHRGGGRIREVPITFIERTQGHSKMDRAIVLEALINVTAWGARERSRQWRMWWSRKGQALRRRS
ncbi:MAG TPA: polyprenol monophosphomannose synthase [Beutenbergiaceae bacterium]|nr:polyprenol monophosphomannose synthase [Beutenbergiaceae bacterium]